MKPLENSTGEKQGKRYSAAKEPGSIAEQLHVRLSAPTMLISVLFYARVLKQSNRPDL